MRDIEREETIIDYAVDLRSIVERGAKALLAIADTDAARRPAPGKWSPKELVGHLIDSAANNHQRFVRAVGRDDLSFPGYEQDAWVELQHYGEEPWDTLVALWRAYNLHLAHLMESIPEPERMRPRMPHNLDQIGWQPFPTDRPATLDYFMRDYVGHLRHHLRSLGIE